ncbi:hypothetical protein Sste5346_006885 [Sporothrix stenoceras]|uniref:Zn(2)-C6 fungal-type domain-containing protein n=1 Tax=Sporothrix stenoceras TaxID=5173 RepID=A0ABR3YW32_9PEZI
MSTTPTATPETLSAPAMPTPTRTRTPKTRSRSGCYNCRRRKRKCDEQRPTCQGCVRRKETCEWGMRVTFRSRNALSLKGGSRKRAGDVRPVVWSDNASSPGNTLDSSLRSRPATSLPAHQSTSTTAHNIHSNNNTHGFLYNDGNEDDSYNSHNSYDTPSAYSPTVSLPPASREPFRYDSNMSAVIAAPSISTPMPTGMENMNTDDSVIATLVSTSGMARGQVDQTTDATVSAWNENGTACEDTAAQPLEWPSHLLSDDHDAPALSQDEEVALWTNWFEEIAPWLDKFDTQRHFQHVLPTMAQTCESLRYAMLALSARQIERKEQEVADAAAEASVAEGGQGDAGNNAHKEKSNTSRTNRRTEDTGRSLALYQQAIHLLLPQLHTRTTAVIAACVVLCVLEMMSCSPKAWRRHLDGCAGLMQAVGCHGFVGGVEQALFWCFARMDVCGGLISSVRTLIPTELWVSGSADANGDLDDPGARFDRSDACGFDMAANHAIFLMAQVLDLLYAGPEAPNDKDKEKEHAGSHRPAPPPVWSEAYRARWLRLWRRVEDWRARRPAELHEILTIPASEAAGSATPFPTLLYSNPAAISGNQMYHTAAVLLLQNLPFSVRFSHLASLSPSPRVPPHSVLWHARQICGISLTNHHHGAWTNSIQPLWIAGRCMSHVSEHRAILALMRQIQRESGWAAQWRADDLVEVWGD